MKGFITLGMTFLLAIGVIGCSHNDFAININGFATDINGEWKNAEDESVSYSFSRKGDTLEKTSTNDKLVLKQTFNIWNEERDSMQLEFEDMLLKDLSGDKVELTKSEIEDVRKEFKEKKGQRIMLIDHNKIATVPGDTPTEYTPKHDEIFNRQ